MKCSILRCFLLVGSLASAQYYQAPVDIPIELSGTFAELRGTHFHAGIDIRTQSKEGIPLRAVADGYVSRIKIQQGGYGKALYINHPNGTTSVYAHLKRYSPAIVPHVRKKQYAKKRYTVEFFPEPDEIPIKKGALIGYSGNTGSSFGPHLHFELRTTANQIPFNPLLANKYVTDTKRPIIKQLIGYPIDGIINRSEEQIQLSITQKNDSVYLAEPVQAIGKIGFGVEHFDQQDQSWYKNGAFKIRSKLNGASRFHIKFDTLSFDDTRHMHKLIDYPLYVDTKKKVMRLFNTFSEPVPFASYTDEGMVTVAAGERVTYSITMSDIDGNNTYLHVPIEGKAANVWVPKKSVVAGKMIHPKRDYLFQFNDAELYFGAKTFSEPTPLKIETIGDSLHIGNDYAYFIKPYKVTLKKKDSSKGAYLALKRKNHWGFVAKKNKDGEFSAKLKSTGLLAVLKDTIPPTITDQKNIGNRWISLEKDIRFTIDDKGSGIKKFEGYLNDSWVLFEYEQKKKELIFRFRDPVKLRRTKHNLKLIVWDNVDNSTTFETTFYRKE